MGRKLDVDALANGVGFPQNADIGQSVLTGPSGVLVIMSGSTFAVSLRVMGVITKVKKELGANEPPQKRPGCLATQWA